MPLFWFLLGAFTSVALMCVLLPWLRTIPRCNSLPALPWQAPLVGLLMIAAALLLYRWLGRPDLATIVPHASATATLPAGDGPTSTSVASLPNAGSMQNVVASLQARLANGGGTPDDWELLAKSYDFIGQPDAAATARRHELPNALSAGVAASSAQPPPVITPDSLKLIEKANRARRNKQFAVASAVYAQLAQQGQMNADTWADYADAAASAQGGKLAGAPESYIARALALNPGHSKALWLQASAAEEEGRMPAAVDAWRQLQATLPANSQDAKLVTANLERDREIAGAPTPGVVAVSASTAVSGSAAVNGGTAVSGEVSVSNSLRSQAAAGGVLFIVAKSVDSPGPPVAVSRASVGKWPMSFTLDDSNSMVPGRNLSSINRVTIEARISQSGQALPAGGDLRGNTGVIDPREHRPLKIVIDEVVK